MLLRKHLDVFCTGALPLLAGYQVPVYKQKDAERSFFFEQRYWLSAMKVPNIKDYQKNERHRYWDAIKHDFRLGDDDFGRPPCDHSSEKPLPLMMSSAGLLAWACYRGRVSAKGHLPSRTVSYAGIMMSFFECASVGASILHDTGVRLPSIAVGHASVDFEDRKLGGVYAGKLVNFWPTLPAEWDMLRSSCVGFGLEPWSDVCSLADLFRFMDLRCAASEDIDPNSWMLDLRVALLRLSAWLVNVAVEVDLATSASLAAQPTVLFGKDGQRRAHHQHGTRMVMATALHGTGSRETICRAVSGQTHSLAASHRARLVELYITNVREAYHLVPSLRLHWDGSHHGGLDVQVGCALTRNLLQPSQVLAAYLQPAVPS